MKKGNVQGYVFAPYILVEGTPTMSPTYMDPTKCDNIRQAGLIKDLSRYSNIVSKEYVDSNYATLGFNGSK